MRVSKPNRSSTGLFIAAFLTISVLFILSRSWAERDIIQQTLDHSAGNCQVQVESRSGISNPPAIKGTISFDSQDASHQLNKSDNVWLTSKTARNQVGYHLFYFDALRDSLDLDSFTVTWEGHAQADSVRLYLWDYNSSLWLPAGIHPGSTDSVINIHIWREPWKYFKNGLKLLITHKSSRFLFKKKLKTDYVGCTISSSDKITRNPLLTGPAPHSYHNKIIKVDYELPEPAGDSAVILTFIQSGGAPDNGAPHILTLMGSLTSQGKHSLDIDAKQLLKSPLVASDSTEKGYLINGSRYKVILEYQDTVPNLPARVSLGPWLYDTTSPRISSVYPVDSISINTTALSYTLSEDLASAQAVWTWIGGAPDASSPHIQTLEAKELLGTNRPLSPLTQSIALIHAAVYKLVIEGGDSASNPMSKYEVKNIIFDNITEPPALILPESHSHVNSAIRIKYNLPEPARPGSLALVFTPLSKDTTTVTVTLNPASHLKGEHTFALTGTNIKSGQVLTVTPEGTTSLRDSTLYNVTLRYMDTLENKAASITAGSVFYDTASPQLAIIKPSPSTSVNHSRISYYISEELDSGHIIWDPAAGSTDTTIHIQPLTKMEIIPGEHNNVLLKHPPALKDSGLYTISMEAWDLAGNKGVCPKIQNIIYDTTTQKPLLTAPAAGSYENSSLCISFFLPEAPKPGSVQLNINNTGGTSDKASPYIIPLSIFNPAPGQNNLLLNADSVNINQQGLVDGSIYTVALTYQDTLKNPISKTNINTFTYDKFTGTPALIFPISQVHINRSFKVEYKLPEPALPGSVKIIFKPVKGDTTTVTATLSTPNALQGSHSFRLSGTNLKSSKNILESAPVNNLTDSTLYDITLIYRDTLNNEEAFSSSNAVFYDITAPNLSISYPGTSSSVKDSRISYYISEDLDSAYIIWERTGGSADTLSPHTQPLTGAEFKSGGHNKIILQRPPALRDSASYTIHMEAWDLAGNHGLSPLVTNIYFDTTTQAPLWTSPVPNSRGNSKIKLSFTLPEHPVPNSVSVTFENTGGSRDIYSPHTIPLDAFKPVPGSNTLTLNGSSLTLQNKGLVNDAVYAITITYQDTLNNPAAKGRIEAYTYDILTQRPVLKAPLGHTAFNQNIAVIYALPEKVQDATCKLTFIRTGGTADTASPHILSLNGILGAAGEHTIKLNGQNLNSHTLIKPSKPGNRALVHGAIYQLNIEYADTVGNPVAVTIIPDLTYDNITEDVRLSTPGDSSYINKTLTLEYSLKETALPGSLQLKFTASGGNDDIKSPHIVYLKPQWGIPSRHKVILNTGDLSANTFTDTVSTQPHDALVDGCIYKIEIEYTDTLGNSPARTIIKNITHDTTPPIFIVSTPRSHSAIKATAITYRLSESLIRGAITWRHKGPSHGIEDPKPRIINLEPNNLTQGTHSISLPDTLPPLLHGTTYRIIFEGTDKARNHSKAFSLEKVLYDIRTQCPSIVYPVNKGYINSNIALAYNLPEPAAGGTVKLFFQPQDSGSNLPGAFILTPDMETMGKHEPDLNAQDLSASPSISRKGLGAPDSLFHNQAYNIIFSYSDSLLNPPCIAMVKNITYDNVAPIIDSVSPYASTTVNKSHVTYRLSENTAQGSFTWTNTGGIGDTGTIHTRIFKESELLAGTHINVQAAPKQALVDGAIYSLAINASDSAGNKASEIIHKAITYDITTRPPQLTYPQSGSIGNNSTSALFILPEYAGKGTVALVFERLSGPTDPGSPHILVLDSTIQAPGTYKLDLNLQSLSKSEHIYYVNSAPGDSLINGTVYRVKAAYKDSVGNKAANTSNEPFTYDNVTNKPVFTQPSSYSSVAGTIPLAFTLTEQPLPGSLKLTFTRTQGFADPASPHILLLNNALENTTPQVLTLTGKCLSGNPGVRKALSYPRDTLQDGAVYSLKLEYADTLNNNPGVAVHENIKYDISTSPPILESPGRDERSNTPVSTYFTLPEPALKGSVKLTFKFEETSEIAQIPEISDDDNSADGTLAEENTQPEQKGNTHAKYSDDEISFGIDESEFALKKNNSPDISWDTDKSTPVNLDNSEALISFSSDFGEPDLASPHTLTFSEEYEKEGSHLVTLNGKRLSKSQGVIKTSSFPNDKLISGGIYTMILAYQDTLNNSVSSQITPNFIYDLTAPQITPVFPKPGSTIHSAHISYFLSEALSSAQVTWTRKGGEKDENSPYELTLAGEDLTAGTHKKVLVQNAPKLVNGSYYDISFTGVDYAGNPAKTAVIKKLYMESMLQFLESLE